MKKTYLFFLLLAFALGSAEAAYHFSGSNGTVSVECAPEDLPALNSRMASRGLHLIAPSELKQHLAPRTDQQLFNLTLDLVCDAGKGEYPSFQQMVWTSDGSTYYDVYAFEEDEPLMVSVPAGTYDILGVFESSSGHICVAKENISVTADCTVTIHSSEATNLIRFSPLLSDGEEMALDTRNINTDEIVSYGNINATICGPSVFHNNHASFSSWLSFGFNNKVDSEGNVINDVFRNTDVHINETERFYFLYELATTTKENGSPLGCSMISDRTKTQTVFNNISDYLYYAPSFAGAVLSRLPEQTEAYYNVCSINLRQLLDEQTWASLDFSDEALNPTDYSLCLSLPESYKYKYFWTPSTILAAKMWGGGTFGIECPAVIEIDGVPQVLPSQILAPKYPEYMGIAPKVHHHEFNREFAFPYNDSFIFGNSCPLWVPFLNTGEWVSFGYNFVCRANEFRSVDFLDHSVKCTADGTTVFDSYEQLTDELGSSIPDWHAYKQVDIEVANRNLKIDGRILINGQAKMHLDVEAVNEYGYPLITMLQFRDKDNAVTDRFASAEGTMMLSGATFKMETDYSYEWPMNYFVPSRLPEVKAEYSRHDRNEFQPLTLSVDEAVGLMPTYGWMYRADIAQLGTDAEEGWYDLRLTAADTHGNFIEQIVSPAFLIGQDDSGVTESLISSDDVRVEGKRIVAPAGSRVLTLSGLPAATGELPAGLYLVRTPDGRTAKVLVD